MATKYKRTTVKTGPYTKRTTTVSSAGTRVTVSNKPPGAATRRTLSTNLKTGKSRITHTTKQGGGWFTTSSKTFGGSKARRSSSGRRGKSGSGGFSFFWVFVILLILWALS